MLHGGVIAALLDVALGDNLAPEANGVFSGGTAVLNIQFVATALPGEWVEASATLTTLGRRLAHAQGELRCDRRLLAIGSASFAVSNQSTTGARRHHAHDLE
jgi:acyl-coenzyme A thioesterase PaaI-like protein